MFGFRFFVGNLVVNEIVESDNRTNERRDVNDEKHVVSFDRKGLDEVIMIEIGHEIEDILELRDDSMIDRKFASANIFQIVAGFFEMADKRAERK